MKRVVLFVYGFPSRFHRDISISAIYLKYKKMTDEEKRYDSLQKQNFLPKECQSGTLVLGSFDSSGFEKEGSAENKESK